MKKEIIYTNEAREGLVEGINKLANAVKVTLGASGKNVLIEDLYGGSPHITKDGVTVAKAVELQNSLEAQGAKLLKQVAINTNDVAGDGTTTSIVIAQELINGVYEDFSSDTSGKINPILVKKGIDKTIKWVINKLQESKIIIDNTNKEHLVNIASVSANGDKEIGELIASAFIKIGKYGNVRLKESTTKDTYVEFIKGMTVENGLIDSNLKFNQDDEVVLKNPLILITDKIIESGKDLNLELLEPVIQGTVPLLIICEQIGEGLLMDLSIRNKTQNTKIFAIKAPSFGEQKFNILEDIALLTGGKYITESASLVDMTLEDFGKADSIIIKNDVTNIIGGDGDKKLINQKIKSLNKKISTTTETYAKDTLIERMSKLSGGVAILHIGAKSEVELKELQDRIEDSVNATKAAISDGVIAGGGVPLYRIAEEELMKETFAVNMENESELIGYKNVLYALQAPIYSILENAGIIDRDEITEPIYQNDDKNYGYDVRNEKFGNMIELGIIDPVKVTITALENASSVVGTLITTDCVIYNKEEEIKDRLSF